MRNTIAPVLMNAGFRGNVIPGSAEATINVRLIPGTDPADLVREIQRVIGDPSDRGQARRIQRGRSVRRRRREDTDLYRALREGSRAGSFLAPK